MQLIDALAAGVRGAENGYATLLKRGSTTPAIVYSTYDAASTISQPVVLDSNGGRELYVSEEVDVTVQDSSGANVRTFTQMVSANNVEYIGPSFTGRRYSDALAAVNQPITVQAALDLWATSSASKDFKVSIAGVDTTLVNAFAAIAGIFINVKSPAYGAVGDGATDDTTSIQNALNAANLSKGIVLFPVGNYRITAKLQIPLGVNLWGLGANSSIIKMDHATADTLEFDAGAADGPQEVRNLGFEFLQANTGKVVHLTNTSGRIVQIHGCVMGGTTGLHTGDVVVMTLGSLLISDSIVWVKTSGGINADAVARLDMRNTLVRLVAAGAYNGALVTINYGSITGCRLDASAATSGTNAGVSVDGTPGAPKVQVMGCYFVGNTAGTSVGLAYANGNVATASLVEAGNTFEGWDANYTGVSMGTNNPQIQLVGRESKIRNVSSDATPLDLQGELYGVVIVTRTAGGAQAFTSTVGPPGSFLEVVVYNNSGGVLGANPTFSTGFYAGTPAMTAPTNGKISTRKFRAVYAAGTGAWAPEEASDI